MKANIMRAVADSCAECMALRWPMKRTAMADEAHCDDRCSTLRQTTLDFRLKTEADQPKPLRALDKRPKAGGGKKRAFRVSTERMQPPKAACCRRRERTISCRSSKFIPESQQKRRESTLYSLIILPARTAIPPKKTYLCTRKQDCPRQGEGIPTQHDSIKRANHLAASGMEQPMGRAVDLASRGHRLAAHPERSD